MPVYYFNLFSQNDISKDWKKGKDGWERRCSIHDQKGDVIDFESIRKITDACASIVGVRYDDNFMAPVNQLRRQLVDMTFDSSWLWEEEVTDHGDIISPHIEQSVARAARLGRHLARVAKGFEGKDASGRLAGR